MFIFPLVGHPDCPGIINFPSAPFIVLSFSLATPLIFGKTVSDILFLRAKIYFLFFTSYPEYSLFNSVLLSDNISFMISKVIFLISSKIIRLVFPFSEKSYGSFFNCSKSYPRAFPTDLSAASIPQLSILIRA